MNIVNKTSWQAAAVTAAALFSGGIAQAHDRGHENQQWHNQGHNDRNWHDRGTGYGPNHRASHPTYYSEHRRWAPPPPRHWMTHQHYHSYGHSYGHNYGHNDGQGYVSYSDSSWGYVAPSAQFVVSIPLY
jgi:hypothetical protein